MSIYILDTETTNNKPPMEIVELAWSYLQLAEDKFIKKFSFSSYFNPMLDISFGAMATHGIIKDMLLKQPEASTVRKYLPEDMDYLVGHNIIFDWKALGKPSCKRICTLSLSRALFPKLDSHTLGAMFLFFSPKEDLQTSIAYLKNAHSAVTDISINTIVLNNLIAVLIERGLLTSSFTLEEFYEVSQDLYLPKILTFGKYKGVKIKNVPIDYIKWFLQQPEIDEPLELAFKKRLKG